MMSFLMSWQTADTALLNSLETQKLWLTSINRTSIE